MAASASDKFQLVGNETSTTLASNYTSGGTTVTVGSTAGWPTTTGVTFAIDAVTLSGTTEVQTAGTLTLYHGTVANGTTITNVVLASESPNSAQNYAAGSLTRVYMPVSAAQHNRLIEGIINQHAQDGTHTAVTATSLTVSGTTTLTGNLDVNDSSTAIRDSSDNELVKFSKTASAVNEITVANAATANGPEIQATGGDTNIDIELITKGTGLIRGNGEQVHVGTSATASVATSQTTTSTSYTDLATAGPAVTVNIGNSGMALVTVGAQMKNSGVAFTRMGYAISGATTQAAPAGNTLGVVNTNEYESDRITLETGLTPGSTTFTAKYAVSGGTGTYASRTITVTPL